MCLSVKVCSFFCGRGSKGTTGLSCIAFVAGRSRRKDNSDRVVMRLLDEQRIVPSRSGMIKFSVCSTFK